MRFRRDASDLDERIEIPELLTKTLASLESESMLVLPGEVIIHESDGLVNFGLVRDGRVIAAKDHEVLSAGDELIFVASSAAEDLLKSCLIGKN